MSSPPNRSVKSDDAESQSGSLAEPNPITKAENLPQHPERPQTPRQSSTLEKAEHSLFQGPLPPPEMLEGYSRIPGAVEVILGMAERNQLARLKREENEQKARLTFRENYLAKDFGERRLGQIFGLIVALVGLLGGFLLVYSGQVIPGMLVAFVSCLGPFAARFLPNKRK